MKLACVIALAALPALFACSSGDDGGSERSWDPEITEGAGKTCAPQTCTSLGKTCGQHDDGCGGTVDCGACVGNACTAKTCADLGKTCGKHDDECGGILDCGACATCAADAYAGNTAPDSAADLGTLTDSPVTNKEVAGLTVGEGDEDWFRFAVLDQGFGGNPLIKTTVSAAGLEASVFYLCETSSNSSSCPVAEEKPDSTVGVGCTGHGGATLRTECSGLNENGTAYVRVRKLASAGAAQCVTYKLGIGITQDW